MSDIIISTKDLWSKTAKLAYEISTKKVCNLQFESMEDREEGGLGVVYRYSGEDVRGDSSDLSECGEVDWFEPITLLSSMPKTNNVFQIISNNDQRK